MNNKVTIVCLIYNEGNYICNCIDSVLKENYSFENLEVFFIDGVSTDISFIYM